ncbi:exodeoxyribonuclease V subunit alpha [Pedobacter sp. SAFR-022]|uniref:exodeoxyribonuclease V subunit alpha n=1 Tax=Pedobacter sp. SAFR-022 TaxID=3436861 RepID=UPI003F8010A1
MHTLNDVHHQFASFFADPRLQPYAYLASRKLSEGHICLQLDDLETKKAELPLAYQNLLQDPSVLSDLALVTGNLLDKQPFVLHNNRLYLQRYFKYETLILNRIAEFIATEQHLEGERTRALKTQAAFIGALFPQPAEVGEAATDWQQAAAISAVLNNFTIITGGPGTGKTTTVAKILSILFKINPNLKVALAAPTGKAAARMAESLKTASLSIDASIAEQMHSLEPSTIHRLLKTLVGTPYFKHNKQNPLQHDVVIIDESSMIGVALFANLLDAIGPQTKLIMLGDKDQLASVEAGSLFGDLCQAQEQLNRFSHERTVLINGLNGSLIAQSPIPEQAAVHPLFQHIVELRFSHRFTSAGGIGKLSKAIINNDVPALTAFLQADAEPQVLIDEQHSQKLFESFVAGYSEYIKEPDIKTALQKLNKLRVLCAIREGDQGLYALNRKVEHYLASKDLIHLSGDFYENRPIIITSNNYALGLFNGDVGIVRPDDKGILKAWFEDSAGMLRGIFPGLISQVETVFAMTVHKSQGSEFDQVMVVLPLKEQIALLTRELLYTGVTRAKHKIFIQGTKTVIMQTAVGKVERASGIAERFIND